MKKKSAVHRKSSSIVGGLKRLVFCGAESEKCNFGLVVVVGSRSGLPELANVDN